MKRSIAGFLVVVFSLVFAQGQFQGPSPEVRARLEPYFYLITTVSLVLELETSGEIPLSREQAEQLLPILTELSTSRGYTPERANELLDTIELEILTAEQLIWIDGEFLKRQKAGPEGGGFFGGPPPGGQNAAPQSGANAAPGGRGGPGSVFQKMMAGEPINMFSENPGAKAVLDELISLVGAKLS